MSEKQLNYLNELVELTEKLSLLDDNQLTAICQKTEMIIRKLFGEQSHYLSSLKNIMFWPMYSPVSETVKIQTWTTGQRQLISLLQTMKQDIEFDIEFSEEEINGELGVIHQDPQSNDVFIVHGHDDAMKHAVARAITDLGLRPIILHEQADEGRTVIEKFEDNSHVDFAVVLLSPDDKGYSKEEDPANGKFRARQNVILELGFFVGKIGRKNVLTLVKNDSTGNLDIPSDLAGLVYTKFDSSEGWKMKLVQSLKACGYEADMNKLL